MPAWGEELRQSAGRRRPVLWREVHPYGRHQDQHKLAFGQPCQLRESVIDPLDVRCRMPGHCFAPKPCRWLDGGHDISSISESSRIATGPCSNVEYGRTRPWQEIQNVSVHLVERGGLIQVRNTFGGAVIDRDRTLGLWHAGPAAHSSGHAQTRNQSMLRKPISEPKAAIASARLKALTTV